jgi:hypothetical protein
LIKHRLSKVEARIKPKKAATPGLIIVHHTHDDDMTEAEFRAGLSARARKENADYKARMKERKPEDAARDLIINVVYIKKSGLGLKPEPEPTDAELEGEIKRLEAELKGKAKQ